MTMVIIKRVSVWDKRGSTEMVMESLYVEQTSSR